MWNARLDEAQAGIKIAKRNISNIRYATDTTLITESEEEQKSLFMRVKEWKICLTTQHSKLRSRHPVLFSSVTQLCPTLCDPMNHSMPGLPVHHQLPESTQTHVHWINDAIQPSYPLSSPSPPALNPSQHQGKVAFAWGGQIIGVSASASVLPVNAQGWSPLGRTGWISLQSKGLSRVVSNTTVQKYPFFGTQLSLQSNSRIHTWLLGKP